MAAFFLEQGFGLPEFSIAGLADPGTRLERR